MKNSSRRRGSPASAENAIDRPERCQRIEKRSEIDQLAAGVHEIKVEHLLSGHKIEKIIHKICDLAAFKRQKLVGISTLRSQLTPKRN